MSEPPPGCVRVARRADEIELCARSSLGGAASKAKLAFKWPALCDKEIR
jgi:hypothetical protein